MLVRQPLRGINGTWHVILAIGVGHMDTWTVFPLSCLLGILIGQDVSRVIVGTYVRVTEGPL